ncbi:MAG: NAD(+) diphosphatase [Thermomicrobiales bacterium]|nr:NAD(+) diphosphatase [Thermomicrobiales bacterium]
MDERFLPGIEPPDDWAERRNAWFVFRDGDLLVVESGERIALPDPAALGVEPVRRQYLGALGGVLCWSAEIAISAVPPDVAFLGLRALYGRLTDTLFAVANRAAQIVAWDRDHQFCGRCGTPTEPAPGERARRCPRCGLLAYPRLSPAIIVRIEREGRILLARGRNFAPGRFGVIAGFVEPGESLEEAVHREIAEETGLTVRDVRYFASQPWPFPHTLMVGFTADWAAGEIDLDGVELVEAGWYGLDDLPTVPTRLSIARRLIDDWAARRGATILQP